MKWKFRLIQNHTWNVPSFAEPKSFMKNPKKMCPNHPSSAVIAVVRGSSPRGKCLAQKVTCLVSHQFVTRALNLQGEERLLLQEVSQSRGQALQRHQQRSKSFSSYRPQHSVSFQSTHMSASIQSANTPGWAPFANTGLHLETAERKDPTPTRAITWALVLSFTNELLKGRQTTGIKMKLENPNWAPLLEAHLLDQAGFSLELSGSQGSVVLCGWARIVATFAQELLPFPSLQRGNKALP